MTPGSLHPLSPKAQTLVSAEREILPRPELERRRAALRARTVLWQARRSAELPRARSALVAWWKRGSLAAFGLLGATSAFAAWIALEPAGSPDGSAPLVGSAARAGSAARRPVGERVTPKTTPSDGAGSHSQSAPPAQASQWSPPQVVSNGTRLRPGSTKDQGTSSEELALLDRARRALGAGDFRAALHGVEKHSRSFPKSQLGEEREALRVRALAGAGLSKKAGEAARDFESSYPNSVLVPDLRNGDRTAP